MDKKDTSDSVCILASKLIEVLQYESVDFPTGMAALSMAVAQSANTWGVSEGDALDAVRRCIHIVYKTPEGSRLQ
jgi:hypothetical protein